ncbi:hypothetical protein H0H92_015023, partial [Tricholoma furcatifolium]
MMPLSTEERRDNHNRACQKYRKRNLEKLRASARERMRRLRAHRKDEQHSTTSSMPQSIYDAVLTSEDLPAAVKAALIMALNQRRPVTEIADSSDHLPAAVKAALIMALNQRRPDVADDVHAEQRRSILDNLPPSSEPEYSDSHSDVSDVHV